MRLLKDYYECLACIKSKQTRMIKNLKIQKVSLIVLQQGIRFWNERTFWHEMIYKSLIQTFPYFL